jgi:hypothetical protein
MFIYRRHLAALALGTLGAMPVVRTALAGDDTGGLQAKLQQFEAFPEQRASGSTSAPQRSLRSQRASSSSSPAPSRRLSWRSIFAALRLAASPWMNSCRSMTAFAQ